MVLAGLPVLLLLHVLTVQVLSEVVEHRGHEVSLEHHLHALGLEVAASTGVRAGRGRGRVLLSCQGGVRLVARPRPDVRHGERHGVGGLHTHVS